MRLPLRHSLFLSAFLAGPLAAQKEQKPAVPAVGLEIAGLAGQMVTVLPLTMVVSDPKIPGTTGPAARVKMMRWTDSVFSDILAERAPEVDWVLPPALRKAATRASGLMPSPDKMGQAIMRSRSLKEMPDPLRTYIRQLVAVAGGARYALIPAALYLTPLPGDSLKAEFAAVLADARSGRVVWRTLAVGSGETVADALHAALATILPSDSNTPAP